MSAAMTAASAVASATAGRAAGRPRANAKVRPRQPESAWIFGIIFGIGESARATREGSRARDGERGEEDGMQG